MIQIGVETGYNGGLQKVKKCVTIEQVEECVQLLSDFNLQKHVSLSFIIGFPWETLRDIQKTIATVVYLCGAYGILANVNWLWLMPSDLWFQRRKYKINVDADIFDDPFWYVNSNTFFKTHPNITAEDMNLVDMTIQKFFDSGVIFGYTKLKLRN